MELKLNHFIPKALDEFISMEFEEFDKVKWVTKIQMFFCYFHLKCSQQQR